MKYLLFFDVDGTLVDHGAGITKISSDLRSALDKLREKGNKYFICTGRSYGALPEEIRALNPDGYSLSAGSFVTVHGKVLRNIHFENTILLKLLESLEKVKPLILLECGFDLLSNKTETAGYEELIHVFKIDISKIKSYENADRLLVNKISVTFNDPSDIWVMEGFEKLGATVLPQPVPLSYDITISGMTKKDGLEALKNSLEETIEYKTIAFGDSYNDIEMIKFADIGVAMGNGVPALKEQADIIAQPVDKDGVYLMIKEMGLLD
ncbi:MAG: HAD-IIB family hydrolase [Clostridiaceae bacterium]